MAANVTTNMVNICPSVTRYLYNEDYVELDKEIRRNKDIET